MISSNNAPSAGIDERAFLSSLFTNYVDGSAYKSYQRQTIERTHALRSCATIRSAFSRR